MRKVLVSLVAALALTAAFTATAGAGDRVTPNPATACKALTAIHAGGYTSFSNCVTSIWSDVAAYRFPSDENPNVLIGLDQRCTQFENGVTDPDTGMTFKFTYPGMYLGEGPDWPFVTFTVNTHKQCMLAIYTYHALVGA